VETLAPPLELLMEVRFGLEKGQSLKKTILEYIEKSPEEPWRRDLRLWLQLLEMGRSPEAAMSSMSLTRRQCLEVLGQGLKGEPVYPQICALEDEVFEASRLEIEEFVALLPMKSLIPLLFFQFPAFLALLLGPFLVSFLSHS
jgi:hypothetical protein